MKSPYSIAIQLVILVLSVLAGTIIAGILGSIIVQILKIPLDPQNHTVFLLSVFLTQLIGFTGGFFIFLKLSKQSFKEVINLSTPSFKTILIVIAILITAFPISSVLSYYNSFLKELIPNNYYILRELESDLFVSEFFSIKDSFMLIIKLLVFALLPAIGEELIFRGVLLDKIRKASNNEHYAVIVSGVLFAVIHMQPTKLLPMIFLGMVLGYIYTRTKNILYPMLFHFIFNATTILSLYYLSD